MNPFILSYFDVDVGTADSLWSGWTKDNFAISGTLNITRDIGQEGRESNGVGGEKKSICYFIRAIDQPRQMLIITSFYFFCKLCSFKLKIYLSIFSRLMSKTQLISYFFLFFIILSPVLFSCIIFSLFLLSIFCFSLFFHYFFFCVFFCTVGGVRS